MRGAEVTSKSPQARLSDLSQILGEACLLTDLSALCKHRQTREVR